MAHLPNTLSVRFEEGMTCPTVDAFPAYNYYAPVVVIEETF